MAAAPVPAPAAGAAAAAGVGRGGRRGVGGRALRVGPRHAHAHSVDSGAHARAPLAGRRGSSSACYERGVPRVPQATGAAASLPGAPGAAPTAVPAVPTVPAVPAVPAGRAGPLAGRARRDCLLTLELLIIIALLPTDPIS